MSIKLNKSKQIGGKLVDGRGYNLEYKLCKTKTSKYQI